MQVKTEIPDSLMAYGASTVGPYPARFDRILNHAFTEHRMMLNASNLRTIAGGGSNSTAQEAIERFRVKLSQTLSDKISFAESLPDELAQQAGEFISDLWISAQKEASTTFEDERATLLKEFEALRTQTQVHKDECLRLGESLTSAQDQALANAHQVELCTEQIRALRALQAKSEQEKAHLQSQLDAVIASKGSLISDLDDARSTIRKQHDDFQQERESQRQQFAIQIQEIRREHAATTERLVRERDVARAAEAKERTQHAETTIALAKADQRLSTQEKQISDLRVEIESINQSRISEKEAFQQTLKEADSMNAEMKGQILELQSVRTELLKQIHQIKLHIASEVNLPSSPPDKKKKG